MGLTGSTINNKIFYVPSKETWEVIGTEKDHYILTKDGMTGIAPMAMLPDPDWLCIHCKHYGPWDGNKCLICGQYSFE